MANLLSDEPTTNSIMPKVFCVKDRCSMDLILKYYIKPLIRESSLKVNLSISNLAPLTGTLITIRLDIELSSGHCRLNTGKHKYIKQLSYPRCRQRGHRGRFLGARG
ncbi:hypothetical protein YC2023_076414 [Brassica napus]